MCKAREEQKNEGRELGREEGRIRQAKVTALKLQKKGHSIEDIAAVSYTHLLFIEKSGAPPLPKRLEKAIVSIIIGKQSPTAPSAVVPISCLLYTSGGGSYGI